MNRSLSRAFVATAVVGSVAAAACIDWSENVIECPANAVAAWPMNEGTGSTAHDCDDAAPAILGNGVTWSAKDGIPALAFDGGGATVTAPRLQLAPVELTVVAWIRLDAQPPTAGSIVGRKDSWALRVVRNSNANRLQFGVPTGDQASSSTEIAVGRWYHVGATVHDGNVALYVDGAQVSAGGLRPPKAANSHLTIGTVEGFDGFPGVIRGVAIFATPLTTSDLATLTKP